MPVPEMSIKLIKIDERVTLSWSWYLRKVGVSECSGVDVGMVDVVPVEGIVVNMVVLVVVLVMVGVGTTGEEVTVVVGVVCGAVFGSGGIVTLFSQ